MQSGFVLVLNTTVFSSVQKAIASQQSRHLTNCLPGQRKLVSVFSGLSCSLPYSSFSSLSNRTSQLLLSPPCKRKSMASSSSKAIFGDVYVDDVVTTSSGNVLELVKPAGFFFNETNSSSFHSARVSLRKKKLSNNTLIRGKFLGDVTWRNYSSNIFAGVNNLHACFACGAAADVSFDGSSHEEQFANATIFLTPAISGERTLKLLSGSCYLPHPAKAKTGGEDAHFICVDEQVVGVADGVGGWADVGVDAGLFARELMSNSVRVIQEEPRDLIDPFRVLEKAHSGTKSRGSSTAYIIALLEKELDAINLGDSGFLVVRDGSTIFRSPAQQHGFNFPYQLDSDNEGDLPSSGQVFRILAEAGDVIVVGTDGLFDNLYEHDIVAVVIDSKRTGLESQATAQKLASLAQERAMDRNRPTPFSDGAHEAGFRYYGGKLDDITVVVSYVASSA